MTLHIYTDASMGTGLTAGLGWAYQTKDEEGATATTVSGTLADLPDYLRRSAAYAELLAVRKALSEANRGRYATLRGAVVHMDSRDALRYLRDDDAVNGMPCASNREKARKAAFDDLSRWLRRLARDKGITFKWVKGHGASVLNDAADRAAVLLRRNHEFGLSPAHSQNMLAVLRAEVDVALLDRRKTVTHRGDVVNIQHHRLAGEPLCPACALHLKHVESEARTG